MPTDEEGCKWSCEGCVRGHRATRCGHFERWMIRVKKPGRPLRKCPHVKRPCTCVQELVSMIKIPINTPNGGCMCRRRRDDDDDEGSPPWPPPRGEDPSQPATPLPASPNAQQATMRDQAASLRKSAKKARRQPARNKRAKPSRGQNVKHAKEPKQHAADSIPSEPTTPTRGGPVCCQEDSNLVAQTLSPATVQGNDLAQPFCADSNRHANLDYPPAQPNGTQFQPHVPAHDPAQSVLNNDHAQDLMTQHGVDSAHLTTLNQSRFRMPLEQTGHNYPGSQEAFSTHDSAGVQASAYPAVPTQPGCLCGQSCNCEWCPSHPLNPATQECVNEMTRVLASDHYLDEFPHPSQPEFGTGGTLSNGISTESAVEQGYPPLANDEALDLDPSAWNNMPDQGAPLQPPINQGESVSNNNLSDNFYFATAPNPGYLTVEYPLNRNYSDAPGIQWGFDLEQILLDLWLKAAGIGGDSLRVDVVIVNA